MIISIRLLAIIISTSFLIPVNFIGEFLKFPINQWLLTPQIWLLGILTITGISWVICLITPSKIQEQLNTKITLILRRIFNLPIKLIFFIWAIELYVMSWMAFAFKPGLIDSIIQVFQAKIFAAGTSAFQNNFFLPFFYNQHLVPNGNNWSSQYPPGHSMLLAFGELFGAIWVVPILLTLLTGLFIYRFCLISFNQQIARLCLWLLVLCPYLGFLGVSYMNHITALLGLSIFAFALVKYEQSPSRSLIFFSAFGLGYAFITRPLDALIAGAIFGAPTLWLILKKRAWLDLIVGASTLSLLASLWGCYNHVSTGSFFTPGYVALWGAGHNLGFHATPWGDNFTPLQGLYNQITMLSQLNEFLFEGMIPPLLLLGVTLYLLKKVPFVAQRMLLTFCGFPCLYFFYWHTDTYLGPRLWYSALFCLLPLLAWSLVELSARANQLQNSFILSPKVATITFLKVSLLLYLILAIGNGIPRRLGIYSSGLSSFKDPVIEKLESAQIDQALVFIPTSWGYRIISNLRAAGVSANLAEAAYRKIDHCYLHSLLIDPNNQNEDILVAIQRELTSPKKLIKTRELNDDPTLRLDPTHQLTSACRAEIESDQRQGIKVYMPYFYLNQPDFSGPYVFAADMGKKNKVLQNHYPKLKPFKYIKDQFIPIE